MARRREGRGRGGLCDQTELGGAGLKRASWTNYIHLEEALDILVSKKSLPASGFSSSPHAPTCCMGETCRGFPSFHCSPRSRCGANYPVLPGRAARGGTGFGLGPRGGGAGGESGGVGRGTGRGESQLSGGVGGAVGLFLPPPGGSSGGGRVSSMVGGTRRGSTLQLRTARPYGRPRS